MQTIKKLFIFLILSICPSFVSAVITITVNSTADNPAASPNTSPNSTLGAGIITLRSAVQFSQGTSGDPVMNIIQFDIPTSDPGFQPATNSWLIQPVTIMGSNSAYFINTHPVTVNGYSTGIVFPASVNTNPFAAGSNAILRIEIRGPGIGDGITTTARAFRVIGVPGCVFQGLCINSYLGDPVTNATGGAMRSNASTTVNGCFLGTDILGAAGKDMDNGIFIDPAGSLHCGDGTPANSNVIAGSHPLGCLRITSNLTTNVVQGNYIGTDKTGQIIFDRTQVGISMASTTGSCMINGNLVSGCSSIAIQILGANNNTIINNLVGTDATGTRVLGNTNVGISISNNSSNNTVQNNVVSGCGSMGIQISPAGSPSTLNNNSIVGNKIGLDITGTKVLGNNRAGIAIMNATNTRIGINPTGINPADRNIISGNHENGILINNRSSTGTIDGNIIGSDISGTLITDSSGNAFGNELDGVHIGAVQGPVTNFLVGDAQLVLANEIVNNLGNGVSIVAASNTNTVAGNFIGVNQASKKLGNQLNGVNIDAASNNIIG